jgi:hypothetical protein
MDTVKDLVAGASDAVASAAQSAKESLTGVQEKVCTALHALSCKPAHCDCAANAMKRPSCSWPAACTLPELHHIRK